MKKVLITGTAGFIGSNLVRKAVYDQKNAPTYSFVSIDRVSSNTLNSLYWGKNHTFHIADITDAHVMDVIFQFEKPDIVIHLAANTFVDTSLKDPNSFVNSNVLGTQIIINCCVKYGIEKLVYFSSDEIYGQLINENDPPWTEEAPLNPRNPYAATKAAGELLIKAAHQTHGLTYNITRSSNCYGPRQLPEKLIPKAIKHIMEGKKIPIYGQGQQMRDWTFVADNCTAVMTLLDKATPNQTYNIAAGQEFSNIEVIHQVCNAMGKGHDLIEFIVDPRGGGHDFRYAVDTSKIRALGWKPSYKFKDGIAETVNWYLQNQWFVK